MERTVVNWMRPLNNKAVIISIFCIYLVREDFIFIREKSGNFEKLRLWKPYDQLLSLFNRSVLDNFHTAMNAVNDADIAAVAETLQLAQDAILSDSKQLAGQFVARLYEVQAINTSCANWRSVLVAVQTQLLLLHFVDALEEFAFNRFFFSFKKLIIFI